MGSRRMKETLKLRELKAGGEEREGLGGVEKNMEGGDGRWRIERKASIETE